MPDHRDYPPPTPQPCSDCPWRRNATAGWLGPHDAFEWLNIVHGDSPIACHQTITETNDEGTGDWEHPAIRQCRGAAIYRENRCKSPRNPNVATGPVDKERVFARDEEFVEHHTGERLDIQEIVRRMVESSP